MADVAEICGDDVARELRERIPGILLYVPKKDPKPDAPIQRLDPETIVRLSAHFGGDTIYIQSKRRTFDETFKAVEALVDKNLTTQQIALKLGCTQAYVFQVRRRAGAPRIANKPDPRQIPLFD